MTKMKRIAAAIKEALKVRAGEVLTPETIDDRANNAAMYVMEVLETDCRDSGVINEGSEG